MFWFVVIKWNFMIIMVCKNINGTQSSWKSGWKCTCTILMILPYICRIIFITLAIKYYFTLNIIYGMYHCNCINSPYQNSWSHQNLTHSLHYRNMYNCQLCCCISGYTLHCSAHIRQYLYYHDSYKYTLVIHMCPG